MSSLRGLSYRASLLVRRWISASTPPPLFLSAGAVADAKLWRRRSGMPFMSRLGFCHTQARRRGSSAIFAFSRKSFLSFSSESFWRLFLCEEASLRQRESFVYHERDGIFHWHLL